MLVHGAERLKTHLVHRLFLHQERIFGSHFHFQWYKFFGIERKLPTKISVLEIPFSNTKKNQMRKFWSKHNSFCMLVLCSLLFPSYGGETLALEKSSIFQQCLFMLHSNENIKYILH